MRLQVYCNHRCENLSTIGSKTALNYMNTLKKKKNCQDISLLDRVQFSDLRAGMWLIFIEVDCLMKFRSPRRQLIREVKT